MKRVVNNGTTREPELELSRESRVELRAAEESPAIRLSRLVIAIEFTRVRRLVGRKLHAPYRSP